MIWALNPNSTKDWDCEALLNDAGEIIAYCEAFHGGEHVYPHAVATDGQWRRGGCFYNVSDAKGWAERVAGLHPMKEGDARLSPSSPFAS